MKASSLKGIAVTRKYRLVYCPYRLKMSFHFRRFRQVARPLGNELGDLDILALADIVLIVDGEEVARMTTKRTVPRAPL